MLRTVDELLYYFPEDIILLMAQESCSLFYSYLFTANGSTRMNNTVPIVLGLMVLCMILLALSIGVGCFFCCQKKKIPQTSQTPRTLRTSPSAVPNPIGIESNTVSGVRNGTGMVEVSSRRDKQEPSTHSQPPMAPHYSNFPDKMDVERQEETRDTPSVISSRDNDNQVEEERWLDKNERVTPTPPTRKDKGDFDKSCGENTKAANVTPPEISSGENGENCDEEGLTLSSVSNIEDDD